MKKRTRRLLFYVAITVFLSVSYVAVLYAQGYKYSFADNEFYKTGAIYLKANSDSEVYFENEIIGTTSFFGNSYTIGGLLPGEYSVALTKKDFYPWQKLISVEEGFVTEFSKVFLIDLSESGQKTLLDELNLLFVSPSPVPLSAKLPKVSASPSPTPSAGAIFLEGKNLFRQVDGSAELISENVENYVLSENKNKALWWNDDNEIWVIWLNNSDYQPYKNSGDIQLINSLAERFTDIRWFRGDNHIAVKLSDGRYKIMEIDTRGGLNVLTI